MSDTGNCMSMHQVTSTVLLFSRRSLWLNYLISGLVELDLSQPLASLLVMGIKIHEGRTWYSQVRS